MKENKNKNYHSHIALEGYGVSFYYNSMVGGYLFVQWNNLLNCNNNCKYSHWPKR